MKVVVIIYADGKPNSISLVADPSLEQLQKIVGGYIEPIPRFNKFKGRRVLHAYANEDGKLIPLPSNVAATHEWRECDARIADNLRGDIVLVMPPATDMKSLGEK